MQASFAAFLARELIAALAVVAGASASSSTSTSGARGCPATARSATWCSRPLPADVSPRAGALAIGTLAGLAGGAVCAIRPRSALSRSLDAPATLAVCAPPCLRRPTVVRRHAMPAGAPPVISLAGVTMATVVANAILVEQTFNIPGVLRLSTPATGASRTPGSSTSSC